METRKIADWLQIVGNVGILIGLMFVGIQLYQDRQLKRAELSAGYFENRIFANTAAMGDNPYKSIVKAATHPQEMTAEDAYVFFLNLDNWATLWMRYNRLEELGLGTVPWQDYSGMSLEFNSPMGLRFVEQLLTRPNGLPEAFVEKLRQQLREPERASLFKRRLDNLLGKTPLPEPRQDSPSQ